MRQFVFTAAAISCLAIFAGCASSKSSQPSTAADIQPQQPAEIQIDCDDFMRQSADACFQEEVFDENGQVRHVIDEAGTDLGEIDQNWARSYCDCFAQTAFQTFGCMTVIKHQDLDDSTYATTYQPIVEACFDEPLPPDVNEVPAEAADAQANADFPSDEAQSE